MIAARFIALTLALMPVTALSVAKQRMSYQDAAAAAEAQAQDPNLIEWAREALTPLFETQLKGLLVTCANMASETGPASVRIVVILGREGVAIARDPEGANSVASCIADGLGKWNWPAPPIREVYVPLEFNIRGPAPAKADKAGDKIILDVTPSNKSLERARGE